MTASLLRLSPTVASDVAYQQGSIVVCRECGIPLYRLQRSIYVDEPVTRSLWKYAPVSVADIDALMERSDLDPGQRAVFKLKTRAEWHAHCERIPTIKPDDTAACPACAKDFVFGWIPERHGGDVQFGDKGFKIGLAVIPPFGKARAVVQPRVTA